MSVAATGTSAASTALQTHGWWLASRASGLVALVLVTISVGLGLTMAGKVMRRPGLSRKLMAVHEQTALAGLVAIAVHGITLLGDPWLHPGVSGIAVPFAMSFRPLATGLGIVGGYLAALLGLSYYLRRRIGARLWRKAHRATVVVYMLGLAHAFTAGTDASTVWFRWWVLMTAPVIGGLFVYRVFAQRSARPVASAPTDDASRRRRIATHLLPNSAAIRSSAVGPRLGEAAPPRARLLRPDAPLGGRGPQPLTEEA
jgi:sulfoxide reductase heme-binding subunit YedZ